MLVTYCYSPFHYFSIHFHCFSCFKGRCPVFLSPFHSLHLFQQFQADCVYKKSLEDACYLLLQSVTLVFYSFPLFQLFRGKMSIFLSLFHLLHLLQQFQADCVYEKFSLDACYLLLQSVSLVFH